MKNVQKSIRMTDEVFEAVDSYRGGGFNEKLENLVMDYLHGRDQLQRDINHLRELVDLKHGELVEIQRRVRNAKLVEPRFNALCDALYDLLDGS